MCPAAGYAFFGGARGPRPAGRYVEPRVGDGVPYGFARENRDAYRVRVGGQGGLTVAGEIPADGVGETISACAPNWNSQP